MARRGERIDCSTCRTHDVTSILGWDFMAQLTGTRLSIKFKLYLGTICALITMIGFQFIHADTPLWILVLLAAILVCHKDY